MSATATGRNYSFPAQEAIVQHLEEQYQASNFYQRKDTLNVLAKKLANTVVSQQGLQQMVQQELGNILIPAKRALFSDASSPSTSSMRLSPEDLQGMVKALLGCATPQ